LEFLGLLSPTLQVSDDSCPSPVIVPDPCLGNPPLSVNLFVSRANLVFIGRSLPTGLFQTRPKSFFSHSQNVRSPLEAFLPSRSRLFALLNRRHSPLFPTSLEYHFFSWALFHPVFPKEGSLLSLCILLMRFLLFDPKNDFFQWAWRP